MTSQTPPTRSKRGRKRQAFPPPATEGQRLLQQICTAQNLTYEYVQQSVGALTPGGVMMWLHGKRRPDNQMRARIAGAFQIPPHTWDQRPADDAQATGALPPLLASARPPAPPAPPPAPARSTSTLESCLAVLDDIRGARSDIQLLPGERIKLADAETRVLALRARLERDAERTEDRLVREHPEWQRLKRTILKALMAHPAALKDVTAAIAEEPPPESNGHSS